MRKLKLLWRVLFAEKWIVVTVRNNHPIIEAKSTIELHKQTAIRLNYDLDIEDQQESAVEEAINILSKTI